jgi:hypothetical protein
LPLEAGLDSSLVGSAGVLQPEGHGRVAVRAKRGASLPLEVSSIQFKLLPEKIEIIM